MFTNKKIKFSRRNQAGFTLAEISVVLLIGALIALGAILALPSILANYRAGKVSNEFNIAIPSVQTAYQNNTSFDLLTTNQVAQNHWMSDAFMEVTNNLPSGKLISNWGSIEFKPATGGLSAEVTMDKIPTRECIKISEMFNSDTYLTASINGSSVKDITKARNVDLTVIGTQCNSSTSNTLVFTFGRA